MRWPAGVRAERGLPGRDVLRSRLDLQEGRDDIGVGHPTMRFFAKKNSGLLSTLAVSVLVETSLGGVVEAPIGVVAAGSSWTPTLPQFVVANLLPLLPPDRTAIAFRFTPLLGSWQIDDVYVDPWRMG